jgi:hypothetical protein
VAQTPKVTAPAPAALPPPKRLTLAFAMVFRPSYLLGPIIGFLFDTEAQRNCKTPFFVISFAIFSLCLCVASLGWPSFSA